GQRAAHTFAFLRAAGDEAAVVIVPRLPAALVPDVADGARYRFRLDGGPALYPDPASRFQPDGPHGPSQVVDPRPFDWTDRDWPGVPAEGHVLYEMHVGTFTPEGTWAAAAARLPELVALGITAV